MLSENTHVWPPSCLKLMISAISSEAAAKVILKCLFVSKFDLIHHGFWPNLLTIRWSYFCRCIPEESNELPGERSERSHTTVHPSWQIMAIGGLTLFVVILVICLISLARHIKRLKQRLRHSAEVLVPSNASAPMIVSGHHIRRTWQLKLDPPPPKKKIVISK